MNKKIVSLLVLLVGLTTNAQVKFSGYLQTGLNYTKNKNAETFSFQAKRLRLITDAKASEKLTFRLQIEAFNGINGTRNKNGQLMMHIMDAFATYKVSENFKVRAGQFYSPMGYENYDISPASLETVDFSNIVYQIACRNPYEYNFVEYGRDLGVMVIGDLFDSGEGFKYLHYDFAVTNGAQQLKNDSNLMKDIYASVNVRPIKELSFKATYNTGAYNDSKNSGISNAQMSRMVVGSWYKHKSGLNIRAEYGMIKTHDKKATKYDQAGAYALISYPVGKFLPVLRWDMYKNYEDPSDARNYNRILTGLSYTPVKNLKLQLNYGYMMYDKKYSDITGLKTSHQIQLMSIFKF